MIVTTGDDLTNLDIALTARELNQQVRIVLRLFDETLATKVVGAFAMPVISTSQVAAPAFVAAATGRKVYQAFQLAEQSVHLTDLTLAPTSRLAGKTVRDIQADKRVNIIMHQGPGGVNVNPDPAIVMSAGDTILVIAPIEALREIEALNQPSDQAPGGNGRRSRPPRRPPTESLTRAPGTCPISARGNGRPAGDRHRPSRFRTSHHVEGRSDANAHEPAWVRRIDARRRVLAGAGRRNRTGSYDRRADQDQTGRHRQWRTGVLDRRALSKARRIRDARRGRLFSRRRRQVR